MNGTSRVARREERSFAWGRGDVVAVFALVASVVLIYHRPLFGERFFSDDLLLYHGPVHRYLSERLGTGGLPRWWPHIFGGTPFLENPHVAAFYPATWVAALFPVDRSLTLLLVGHVLFGGVLMYGFARCSLGTSWYASLLAALVFGLGGNIAGHYIHPEHVMTSAWLPGIVWMYRRGRQTGRWELYVAAGVFSGLSVLAGGPQTVYLMALGVGFLAVWDLAWWRRLDSIGLGRTVAGLALMGGIAVGVAAVQLWLTLPFITQSARAGGLSYEAASTFSVPPIYAALLILNPHFFGRQGVDYWGAWNQHELAIYVGILPLLLLVEGIRTSSRRADQLGFIVLGGASLLLAMGRYSPLYEFAYNWLPGLEYFRAPARFLLLFHFSVASLVAIGADSMVAVRLRWRVVGWLVALFVMAAVAAWFITREDFLGRLIILAMPTADRDERLIMEQVRRLGGGISPAMDHFLLLFIKTGLLFGVSIAAVVWATTHRKLGWSTAVIVLVADLALFHRGLPAWSRAGEGTEYLEPRDWAQHIAREADQYRAEVRFWAPNMATLHKLPIADGYAAFWPQQRHAELADATSQSQQYDRWRELFSVAFTVERAGSAVRDDVRGKPLFQSVDEPGVVVVQHQVPPRIRLVHDAVDVPSATEALRRVTSAEFDPAQQVIIERSVRSMPADAATSQPAQRDAPPGMRGRTPSAVDIVTNDPEQLIVNVRSDTLGWLVVSDAYWPAWCATVNGKETPIDRANYYFRAVAVPAGDWTVEMRYRSSLLWLPLAMTLLVCGLSVAFVSWRLWVRR